MDFFHFIISGSNLQNTERYPIWHGPWVKLMLDEDVPALEGDGRN
jgi:hypothetical protein